jgi:branched-chain amino acid transport system permease protein
MTEPTDSAAAAPTGAVSLKNAGDADGDAGSDGSTADLFPARPQAATMLRIVAGVVLAAAALYAPFYFTPTNNKLLAQAVYLAIAAMGLNLLTGFNGQVSIGHGAFFGVGAFTTAQLMVEGGWGFEPTIPLAALAAALLGVLVGFPALRVRGLYLALVTLGLAVLVQPFATRYIKGAGGVALLRPDRIEFSSRLGFLDNDQWEYFVCLAVAVLLFVLAWNLVRSRVGRAMIATRDQEIAASTVGVNLTGVKVGTFALSAAYAGVAGSLSVMVDKLADGTNPIIYFQRSIEFLVAVVIGGAATILGPAVGAFLLIFLRRNTEDLIEGKEVLAPAVLGIALIVIVYILPEGVVGGIRKLVARLTRTKAPPSALTASASTPDSTP